MLSRKRISSSVSAVRGVGTGDWRVSGIINTFRRNEWRTCDFSRTESDGFGRKPFNTGDAGSTEEGCWSILAAACLHQLQRLGLKDALNLVEGAELVMLHLNGVISRSPCVFTSGAILRGTLRLVPTREMLRSA